MRIVLPFPPAELFPNRANGKHWTTTRAKKDEYRDQAFYLTKQSGAIPRPIFAQNEETTFPLALTFVQPDRRHRDLDNMLAAAKHALDGMAKAWGIDDKLFRPLVLDVCYVKGQPALLVDF